MQFRSDVYFEYRPSVEQPSVTYPFERTTVWNKPVKHTTGQESNDSTFNVLSKANLRLPLNLKLQWKTRHVVQSIDRRRWCGQNLIYAGLTASCFLKSSVTRKTFQPTTSIAANEILPYFIIDEEQYSKSHGNGPPVKPAQRTKQTVSYRCQW
jgi:hypothetical protein